MDCRVCEASGAILKEAELNGVARTFRRHQLAESLIGKRRIELTKFHKQEHELVTMVDKWIYAIKNAGTLHVIPSGHAVENLHPFIE